MDRNARGVLAPIVAAKRLEIERLRPHAAALRGAVQAAGPTRRLAAALRSPAVGVIAEFKRRSPSAGWIDREAEVAPVVATYEAAGAAALSILTDQQFFGGSLADLEEARKVSRLPILRKDFILDELQLLETRARGADAALLIVRILEVAQLRDLLEVAAGLELDVLVETHDADEIEFAVSAGARLIGVNNRDLATFATDAELVLRLLDAIPPDRLVVAESGIRDRATVERYGAAGVDAVLIGESLMRDREVGAIGGLVGVQRRARAVPRQ